MKSLQRYATILSSASAQPIADFSSRFIRTVILSHLLSPAFLGAAIALSAIFGTCGMLADVGLAQFVMVNRGPDRAQIIAAARQISIIRGFLLALFIAALAPVLADFFGAKGHVDSIRWLGIVPILSGFYNWRVTQVQTEYNYRPEAITSIVSATAALISIFPASAWFHDERALLVSLVVEAGTRAMVSHIALRAKRVGCVDPAIRKAALTFGLPLIVNGIGLVILSQVDRMIVSNLFGLETLASYSLAVGLAVVPISIIATVLNKISMAFVLRLRSDPREARAAAFVTAWMPIFVGACYALGIGAVLDFAVPLIYGHQYQMTAGVHALITLLVFVRLSRMGVTVLLISTGSTRQMTVANLTAGVGLATGFILGIMYRRLEAVVFGVLLGDIFSFVSMIFFLRLRLPLGSVARHIAVLIVVAVIAAASAFAEPGYVLETRAFIFAFALLFVCFDATVVYRNYLRKYFAHKSIGTAEATSAIPLAEH